MGRKWLSVFFTAMLIGGLILASAIRFGTVKASSIPKPSVPEFTVKPIGPSFDIPPTYSTDPETGEIVISENGYHVEYSAVVITIKNQPF